MNFAVMAHEPLSVSLADLHAVDKRGKWWLVGSAWAGDPLVERQTAQPSSSSSKSKTAAGKSAGVGMKEGGREAGREGTGTKKTEEDALFKLARKTWDEYGG